MKRSASHLLSVVKKIHLISNVFSLKNLATMKIMLKSSGNKKR